MTTADPVVAASPLPPADHSHRRGWSLVLAAPDLIVLAFFCVAVAVAPLAAAGQFRRPLVLVAVLVVVALARGIGPETVTDERGARVGAVLALLVAAGFVVANLASVSEYFVVVRDPAIYTLRAIWLTHHASPNIPVGSALAGARGVPGSYVDASGFFLSGGEWQPQGATLVPALLALGGWLAGESGVLAANLVVGAVALIAVYAVARRLIGPLWALVPMTLLAVSLPMIAFSRAPYTEPAALGLGLAGLLLMRTALRTGRGKPAAAAGLSFGGTFLARPDGLLVVLGTTVALTAVAVLADAPLQRNRFRRLLRWFLLGAAISIGLAFADLGRNSSPYESTSWDQIKPLTELTAAATLVAVLVTISGRRFKVPSRITDKLVRWHGRPMRGRSMRGRSIGGRSKGGRSMPLAAATVLVLFGVLASRPLFYTAHHDGTGVADVAARQSAAGARVDGTRTYDEHTVSWLAWYFGWPLVVLGAVGVAALLVTGARRRDAWTAVMLAMFAVPSLLYLNRALITPDQIWAVRRFLPVVIPLGLIAAAAAAATAVRRWPRAGPVVMVAVLACGLIPLRTWRGVVDETQYQHGRAFAEALCAAAGSDHVVLTDDTDGGRIALPTLRVGCGVQAVLLSVSSPATLLQVRHNWPDSRPITVMTFVVDSVPWLVRPTEPNFVGRFTVWEEPLDRRPSRTVERTMSVYLGQLQADGRVRARA